jgi:ubiquitin
MNVTFLVSILFLAASLGSASRTDAMRIFVVMPNNTTDTLEVEATDTIENVKGKIQDQSGVLPEQQTLFRDSVLLADERTLGDYNVQRDQTLVLRIRQPIPALSGAGVLLLAIGLLGSSGYFLKRPQPLMR